MNTDYTFFCQLTNPHDDMNKFIYDWEKQMMYVINEGDLIVTSESVTDEVFRRANITNPKWRIYTTSMDNIIEFYDLITEKFPEEFV